MLRFWYGLLRSFREPFSNTKLEFGITWVHFGDLGLHFDVFLEALTPLAAQLGHFWGSCRKRDNFSAEVASILVTFLAPKSQKL